MLWEESEQRVKPCDGKETVLWESFPKAAVSRDRQLTETGFDVLFCVILGSLRV